MEMLLRRRPLQEVWGRVSSSYLKAQRKRFYENVDIQPSKDGYLIQLDNRTVKTPLRNPLCVPSRSLAVAVANEWHVQNEEINIHTMPLTNLCNTALDNPTHASKEKLVESMLQFIHTDTVCSLATEPEDLVELQNKKWLPTIDWFSKRYNVTVKASTSLFNTDQSSATVDKLRALLVSFNMWQIYGLQSAIDVTKSFILPMAVTSEYLTVQEAISFSRLEQEFQIEKWGNVEFAHELEKWNHTCALSASVLFYRLNEGLR